MATLTAWHTRGALNAFYAVMPKFDDDVKKIAYMKLLDEATSKGITAAGDAYVFEPDLQALSGPDAGGKTQAAYSLVPRRQSWDP